MKMFILFLHETFENQDSTEMFTCFACRRQDIDLQHHIATLSTTGNDPWASLLFPLPPNVSQQVL